jgi:hypothetical protein
MVSASSPNSMCTQAPRVLSGTRKKMPHRLAEEPVQLPPPVFRPPSASKPPANIKKAMDLIGRPKRGPKGTIWSLRAAAERYECVISTLSRWKSGKVTSSVRGRKPFINEEDLNAVAGTIRVHQKQTDADRNCDVVNMFTVLAKRKDGAGFKGGAPSATATRALKKKMEAYTAREKLKPNADPSIGTIGTGNGITTSHHRQKADKKRSPLPYWGLTIRHLTGCTRNFHIWQLNRDMFCRTMSVQLASTLKRGSSSRKCGTIELFVRECLGQSELGVSRRGRIESRC